MQEAAIAVSFALQYGAKVKDLQAAMPHEKGIPDGPIGTLLHILAKAALDDTEEELLK